MATTRGAKSKNRVSQKPVESNSGNNQSQSLSGCDESTEFKMDDETVVKQSSNHSSHNAEVPRRNSRRQPSGRLDSLKLALMPSQDNGDWLFGDRAASAGLDNLLPFPSIPVGDDVFNRAASLKNQHSLGLGRLFSGLLDMPNDDNHGNMQDALSMPRMMSDFLDTLKHPINFPSPHTVPDYQRGPYPEPAGARQPTGNTPFAFSGNAPQMPQMSTPFANVANNFPNMDGAVVASSNMDTRSFQFQPPPNAVVTSGVLGSVGAGVETSQGANPAATNRTITTTATVVPGTGNPNAQKRPLRALYESRASTSTDDTQAGVRPSQYGSGDGSDREGETDGKQEAKKRRTVGRPIMYPANADTKLLPLHEQRKVRRRIANRESANRVRQKRQQDMDQLKSDLYSLRGENQQLRAYVAQLESTIRGVVDRATEFRDQYVKASRDNIKLYQEVLALQGNLAGGRDNVTDEGFPASAVPGAVEE